MEKTCEWKPDGDVEDGWATACKNLFIFMADGPVQNGFEFCPYCGAALTVENEADS